MRRRLLDLRSKKSKTKAAAGCSTSSASAEPAAAVAHGLQVVAEGTNPTVEHNVQQQELTPGQTSKRPIIFVAHSLGGIVVKSVTTGALEEHRSIKLSAYGVMFIGTPHQGGSGVAFGRLMVNVASVFVAADDGLLRHLERDSEWLQQQLGQYGPISGDFIVPRASAVVPGAANSEPIAIHADHINMVKFGSKSDSGYQTVLGHLQLIVARAGDSIRRQWDREDRLIAVDSNEPIASFTHFVSRGEELNKIYKKLQYDGTRKIAVVHSLGGIGKTQLALAYVQRHKKEYSAVFWVNSTSEDTLKQGYAAAARRIYREHLSLMHLKAMAGSGDVDEEAEAGAIVITTRSSQLQLGSAVAVQKLQDIEHGLEILSHTSKRSRLNKDTAACALAENFADYLRLYEASWLRLQQTTPQLLLYEDRALYSTWNVSLDHVKQQSELAAKLLQLWAYFDNQDVWFELLRECQRDGPEWFSELTKDMLSFNKAVRVLSDHALVEADALFRADSVESRGYSMHSCVHAWTLHVVNEGWGRSMARLALNCVERHVPISNGPLFWVTQQRLVRHANQCQGIISAGLAGQDSEDDEESVFAAVHGLGILYADLGRLDKAEKMYQRALQGCEKAWGCKGPG
ncbi:hypothetical protein CC86DRAFT_445243 [Ophiobolus disseminans]|uniref:Uncharacterized protein n=1 Tax=Ophiobolus disseminans TaxID=1469910 RepID=A0A6A7A376_9PLEO|nr:hypothetical protein CC86DRAFT_445243 [Ophiobolus disseminans]